MANIVQEPKDHHTSFLRKQESSTCFQPICIEHLEDLLLEVMPYLSLENGFGFVIDDNGYEDVWFGDFKT